jgi:phosphoribosylglycinamide formyltransferase 2
MLPSSLDALRAAIDGGIGYPCIVKPTMSSSGKGQSLLRGPDDVQNAWDSASGGPGKSGGGSSSRASSISITKSPCSLSVPATPPATCRLYFCEPIGHVQVAGDYVESWQPQAMTPAALQRARKSLRP